MIKVKDAELQDKIDQLYLWDQGHIFRFWDELNENQKAQMLHQIKGLELQTLKYLIDLNKGKTKPVTDFFHIEPTEVLTLKKRKNRDDAVRILGEEALKDGKIAAFVVAGGQGSRLGFEGPKGLFKITPVQQHSLFQLFAEKIYALNKRYNTHIPWYIMTSETNHVQTAEYFNSQEYFGLGKENVRFLTQAMLPAFNRDGKLILEEKHRLFFSPNGHGGSLTALYEHGALQEMKEKGIEHLFYFQVDNVLADICDPAFMGYHIAAGADMSTKVIRKRTPDEPIGIICKINGQDGVVEYSDLSREDAQARTEDGELKYWAGNVAIHAMRVDFLLSRGEKGIHLPFHRAEKNIPFVDETGKKINPEGKNGIKYEMFIFDLLLDARKTITIEVDRQKEFSPVKNKDGLDSPETAQKDLLRNYSDWLEKAGFRLERDKTGLPAIVFEISPLFALNAQDILRKKDQIGALTNGLVLK